MRKLAVGASVALTFLTTGCLKEAHRWGAELRGAPVVDVGAPGGDDWYTGSASRGADACWDEGSVLGVPVGVLQIVCSTFYAWTEGSLGYIDDRR